ncbi:hypothetical protein GRP75_27695, partial [Paenibacillus sp. OT2-17]|nr:hypothetical protein [Paenibacillus sp. OT2-17]
VEIPVTQQAKSVPVKIVYSGELPDGLALSIFAILTALSLLKLHFTSD